MTRSSANGDALDWGFFDEANYHSFNYRGERIDTRFNSALTTGTGTPSSWDDPANSNLGGGPSFLQEPGEGGGQSLITSIDEGQQIASIGLLSPVGGYGDEDPGDEEQIRDFTAEQIAEFLRQGAAVESNGKVGVFVFVNGVLKLAVYDYNPAHTAWGPTVPSYPYEVPATASFRELLSGYSTGAIGQDPGGEAATLYFTSYVMIGAGVASVVMIPVGASAAVASGGMRGLLIFGASEIASEYTGIPLPTPGGAVKKGATTLADAAIQSGTKLDNLVDTTKDIVRNAPISGEWLSDAMKGFRDGEIIPDSVLERLSSRLRNNTKIIKNEWAQEILEKTGDGAQFMRFKDGSAAILLRPNATRY